MDQSELNPEVAPQTQTPRKGLRSKFSVRVGVISVFIVATLISLRLFGLIRCFSIPTGAMAPALSPGDQVMMEGFTFMAHNPKCGEIVVFETDGIALIPPGQFWVKRVVGEPGDHVSITNGKLFINQVQMPLSNNLGEITFLLPPIGSIQAPYTDVTVPSNCCFVLGDNSTNSFDSRFWGFVPRQNIKGRIWFCYWPSARAGTIR